MCFICYVFVSIVKNRLLVIFMKLYAVYLHIVDTSLLVK